MTVVTTVLGAFTLAALDKYDVMDRVFSDPVSCPTESSSSEPGAPRPSTDAIVILEGKGDGSGGNVVKFKICHDRSAQATSEFWYFGESPGPNTNLAPATKVNDDPARYETAMRLDTFYWVDCATNFFGYTMDGKERSYGFDPDVC